DTTAAGMAVATVRPANSPREAFAAARMTASTTARITARADICRMLVLLIEWPPACACSRPPLPGGGPRDGNAKRARCLASAGRRAISGAPAAGLVDAGRDRLECGEERPKGVGVAPPLAGVGQGQRGGRERQGNRRRREVGPVDAEECRHAPE